MTQLMADQSRQFGFILSQNLPDPSRIIYNILGVARCVILTRHVKRLDLRYERARDCLDRAGKTDRLTDIINNCLHLLRVSLSRIGLSCTVFTECVDTSSCLSVCAATGCGYYTNCNKHTTADHGDRPPATWSLRAVGCASPVRL